MTALCHTARRETGRTASTTGEETRDRKSSARKAGADSQHLSQGVVALDRREPFRLFLRNGSDVYRVTFTISGVRYEGSTRCEEHDLAVMVARAIHAEIRETAGRLAAGDVRRSAKTMRSVRGLWFTLRPRRAPSLAGIRN